MTETTGRRLFKSGAIVLLIIGAVHSLSLISRRAPANDTERQLFNLMSNYQFNLLGTMRTMDTLLRGFSISFMVSALGFAVFDIALFGEGSALLKRAALVNILWLSVMVFVAMRYFFIVPLSFLAVALLLFACAWWMLPSEASS
jgi:hypothetical protein